MVFSAAALLLTGCGGGSSGGSSSAAPSVGSAPSSSPPGFVSERYGYAVPSADWSGTGAATAWDGTGAPGSGDSTVDRLYGPGGQAVFAFGRRIDSGLHRFVVGFRKANAAVHGCPETPEVSGTVAVDGEQAIVDGEICNGVFATTAYVEHHGHVIVFFNYGDPGERESLRQSMNTLLETVRFQSK